MQVGSHLHASKVAESRIDDASFETKSVLVFVRFSSYFLPAAAVAAPRNKGFRIRIALGHLQCTASNSLIFS